MGPALQIVLPSLSASDFSSRIVCPICCTRQAGLVSGCGSSCHLACLRCWSRWAKSQADRMRLQRHMGSCTCFFDGCREPLHTRIWESEVLNPECLKLRNDFQRRSELLQDVL